MLLILTVFFSVSKGDDTLEILFLKENFSVCSMLILALTDSAVCCEQLVIVVWLYFDVSSKQALHSVNCEVMVVLEG